MTSDAAAALKLSGGLSFAQTSHVSVPGEGHGRVSYGTSRQLRGLGLAGGVAVGAHCNASEESSFRAELNGSFRRNRIERFRVADQRFGATGHTDVSAGVLNLFYEHDFGELAWVKAYIGAGAGVGLIDVDYRSPVFISAVTGNDSRIIASDDAMEPAWNGWPEWCYRSSTTST